MNYTVRSILIISGILIIIKIVTAILQYLDLQIDYSNKKNLGNYLQEIEGKDYLIVPYFIWQKGKLQEIKKRYSEYYPNPRDRKTYKLGIIYERCAHEKDDIILPGLHRDYRAAVILEDKSTTGSTYPSSPTGFTRTASISSSLYANKYGFTLKYRLSASAVYL